jgi:hypothetical protein
MGASLAAGGVLLALAAAACGNNDAKSESSASQASIEQLAARVQQNQMLDSLITVVGLPVHEMDSTAQGGKIDNKYVPTARMLVRVTALTEWSPELTADVQKLHDDSVKLLQALDAGKDVQDIKPLSQSVHEDWHTFTDKAWDVVAKDLPADAGGPKGAHEEDSSGSQTPSDHMDNMTPAQHDGVTPPAGAAH